MANEDCIEEATSQHHGAPTQGFGPVGDDEVVLFAVFACTKRNGSRLGPASFESKQLRRFEVSLARLDHTGRVEFETHVIQPVSQFMGPFVGVAKAITAELRKIPLQAGNGTNEKACCVIDKVTIYDHDGHAAIGYSAAMEALNDKQKKKIRPLVSADLAETFTEVMTVEEVY